jgi:hypothetical protein
MGSIVDAVFGGSAKDAARTQQQGTREAMAEYKRGVAEAKREIRPAFEGAEQSRLERTQQAMDMLGSGFEPQLDVMSQGNMNAQQMLAGSMPQMQNAILGAPVDYGFMQPQGVDFNAGDFLSGTPSVFTPPEQQVDTGAVMGTDVTKNPFVEGGYTKNATNVNLDALPYGGFMSGDAAGHMPFGGGRTEFFQGGGNQPVFSNDFAGGTGGQGGRAISGMPRLNLR